MKVCRKCGKTAETDGSFCEHCGGNLADAAFCPHCGAAMPADEAVCASCGKNKNETEENDSREIAGGAKTPADSDGKKNKKKKGKKTLFITAAAVFVFLAAIGSVLLLRPKTKSVDALMYKNGDEIYYLCSDKGESILALRDSEWDWADGALIRGGETAVYRSFGWEEGELYRLSPKNSEVKPKKIDTVSYKWSVTEDGTLIYIDDREELYFGTVEKPEKIDSHVSEFCYYEKNGSLTYLTDDGDLFFMTKGKEAERVGRNCSALGFVSENGKEILFRDDDGRVYSKKAGKEKEKILSDVNTLDYASSNLSEILFTDNKGNLCRKKGTKNPEILFDGECRTVGDEIKSVVFLHPYDRNESEEDTLGDLFVFDGTDCVPIEENVAGVYTAEISSQKAGDAYVYGYHRILSDEKERWSYFLLLNGECRTFDDLTGEEAEDYLYLMEENTLYIYGEKGIYALKLSEKLPDAAEKISEYPVDFDYITGISVWQNQPVYQTETYDEAYTLTETHLVWGNTEVADATVSDTAATDRYLYYIATDGSKRYGSLYRFDGEKSILLLEDASEVCCCNDKVYCIADYSQKSENGTLYVIRSGKKPKKVTDEATRLFVLSSAD